MFKRLTLAVFVMVLSGFFLSKDSLADRRSYVWTYEYLTMPKGETELEYYLDFKEKELNDKTTSAWKHQLEIEHGITDRWDLSVYQVFSQENGEALRYDELKIRTRYRFSESGNWFLDPLIYLEYKKPSEVSSADELEGKLVLAKDISNLNFAWNLVFEREIRSKAETEVKYAMGLSYQLVPAFKIGLEGKGDLGKNRDSKHYLSPAFSFASGKLWITLGTAFGLTSKSDDFQFRYILGLSL
ncbi:MAG: hypothetical protein Q8O10_10050 [candidate division Zixibacteria bacterium]|nr:hypothetical protein [candidate division Zixibacteria bacterium]